MSGELVQYITDHSAAGECAVMHYQGQHDLTRCVLPPGYCSMIAYLTALLRNAEGRPPTAPYAPTPPIMPIAPVTSGALPLTYGGQGSTNAGSYSGGPGGGNGGSTGGSGGGGGQA